MTTRRPTRGGDDCGAGGFGGFLRSLLAGIPWSEVAEGTEEIHFDSPPGDVVWLHNSNGRTRVVGEDRKDVLVRVAKSVRAESAEAARKMLGRMRVMGNHVGDALELEVEMPRSWNRRGHSHIELRVPRETHVEVSNPNGKVWVEDIHGRVQLRSSCGSARVLDVVGDIDVTTANARVHCSSNIGRLVARSSNGKIQIDAHRGSVDASTSNGAVRVSLEAVGKRGVALATSNGRIICELPEPVDADVDVWVDNGTIRNDRELSSASRETGGRLIGRLGHGGPLVKLRTSNGAISLR